MRQIFSIVLILAIALHLFSELGIYISFKINQDYISKNLCVEKDIPNSTCHGCCQLKKKLKTSEEQKEENPQSTNKKPEIQFFNPGSAIAFSSPAKSYQIIIPKAIDTSILLTESIFRPPKEIA